MAKHSITAVFDTRSHAEAAMAQLTSSGVAASDITLLPAAGEPVSSTETDDGKGKGFWGSLEQLFGGTEDHATYAESIRRGGIMLSVRAEDERLDHVIDILEQHGSVDLDEREANWRSEGWTGTSNVSGDRLSGAALGSGVLGAGILGAGALGKTANEERREVVTPIQPVAGRSSLVTDRAVNDRATVPAGARDAGETVKVYEERLNVGKRSVSRGKVRVRTSVVSREVSESVTLHSETVSVDRRPLDLPVSAAALGVDPFKERTIELEEFAEEVVVAKSAHVVEEIGIHKEAVDRVETVQETLRKTVVDIDDTRTGGVKAGPLNRFAAEIRDDMEVVGSDGAHVGTVDHLDGDRIKLKKADVSSGGQHHYLAQDMVQSVAGKVMLAVTAAEAKARWATA